MITIPSEPAAAISVLNQLRTVGTKCTVIVFERHAVAADAEIRANTPLRQVAFAEVPSVMDRVSGFAAVNSARAAGAVAVAMTLAFNVSSVLKADEADISALEDAFAKAEIDS